MTDSTNTMIGAILVAVALVGIGGLYLSTSSGQQGYTGPYSITGADEFQIASGDFMVADLTNVQCKVLDGQGDPFADSCYIDADIAFEQVILCTFATADPALDGTAPLAYPEAGTLTPYDTGCAVAYTSLSETDPSQGAFGVENLGNVALHISAIDATGSAFGGSSTREIIAHEQNDGDCPDEDVGTPNLCIKTTNGPGTDVDYEPLALASVDLCGRLAVGGGLEIDLRYGVPTTTLPGAYPESITINADTIIDNTCA